MKAHLFGQLLPVDVAVARILAAARTVDRTESIRLGEALGRVAAADVRAARPVPRVRRATWDGFAVSAAQTQDATASRPRRFRIVGDVFAEQSYPGRLSQGEAVAIATGGEVPRGADAVIIFEEARVERGHVKVPRRLRVGARIAQIGDDIPKGSKVVQSGQVLGPADLGALATVGVTRVRVFARPRISIVPNGNELVAPGSRLRPGTIYESNNFSLGAVVAASGGLVERVSPVRDDPRVIERAIRQAMRRSDLVLVTGGSSVGERDFLPRIFPKLGRLLFHGIAVRPGKPTLVVQTRNGLVVGMPGHPASCLANSFWLLLPLLRKLAHLPGPGWRDGEIRLGNDAIAPTRGLSTVVPLRIVGSRGFSTFEDSSSITSLRGASAFAILPPSLRVVRGGTKLRVHFLPPPIASVFP